MDSENKTVENNKIASKAKAVDLLKIIFDFYKKIT